MVEAIVTGAVVAGGIAVLARRQAPTTTPLTAGRFAVNPMLDAATDLPCPWCRAATAETDTHCPNCHQRFG